MIHVSLSATTTLLRLQHRELRHRIPMYGIILMQIYQPMWQQRANPHRQWWEDWKLFVISDENRFSSDYNYGNVSYTGKIYLPECVTRCQTQRSPSVMEWGAIGYHG